MTKSSPDPDKPQIYKEGEPTERVHIWLYASDIEWIDTHVDAVKRSKFIRLALRRTINAYKAKANELAQAAPVRAGGAKV